MSKKLSISKAIGEALHEEMARDENVIIMGEDMGKMGNVFGITVGFQEEFGENRVCGRSYHQSGCKDEIYDRRTGNRTHGIETAHGRRQKKRRTAFAVL